MFLGDKGEASKYRNVRYNYDILVDNEKAILRKLSEKLGFYDIVFDTQLKDIEISYDTPTNLLSNTGLIIRKKIDNKRSYFTLIRISDLRTNQQDRERKEFLGECEPKDQPSDFPVQIADKINEIFNNLFTVNLVDIIKHTKPYLVIEVRGNRYKIISGTGYNAELCFETLHVRNMHNGKKAKIRNVSVAFTLLPEYEHERNEILGAIDKYCKELVPLNRNHFEVAEVAVRTRVPVENDKDKKKKGKQDRREERKEEGE